MTQGTRVVTISVCLDTEAIQKRPRAVWISLLSEELHGMTEGTWEEIYQTIALSYVAGGDHSEYVIWQDNDVKEED